MNEGCRRVKDTSTDDVDNRPSAVVAKGTPLSVRMIAGKPYS